MEDLGLIIKNDKIVVSSRKVAEVYGKDHSDVLKKIRGFIQDVPELGIGTFTETHYIHEQNGQVYPEYLMDRQGFSILVNKFTGKQALKFTVMYTKAFEKMAAELQNRRPVIPQIDSKFLYQIAAQLEEKEKQIALMKPKADFYDAVAGSKDAIEIGQAAKVLNMGLGRNKLFKFLRSKKILQSDNIPYQEYIDRGYFRTIEQKWTTPAGETRINIKTLVYQKGLDYIRKLLQGEQSKQA